MQTTINHKGRTFYLLIDQYTIAVNMTQSKVDDSLFTVELIRKVADEVFGDALDRIPVGFTHCYEKASTLIAFTDFGVAEKDRMYSYQVKLVGGLLEYRELPGVKIAEAFNVEV